MTSRIALASLGCSSEDATLMQDRASISEGIGAARLNLMVGERDIASVTAVISGKRGFKTQTHVIDVGGSGVVSIFFGNLPVGHGYEIELTAGDVPLHILRFVRLPLFLDRGAARFQPALEQPCPLVGRGDNGLGGAMAGLDTAATGPPSPW